MDENLSYGYVFEHNGALIPDAILPEDIWVGVGGYCGDGAFDHHAEDNALTTFDQILQKKGNLSSARNYIVKASAESIPKVVFHVYHPGLDCLASLFLLQCMLVQHTDSCEELFSARTLEKMSSFIRMINQGRKKSLTVPTLYAYIHILAQQEKEDDFLNKALPVMKAVFHAIEENSVIELSSSPIDEYVDPALLSNLEEVRQTIQSAKNRYEQEKKNNHVSIRLTGIFDKNSHQMVPVKTAIWNELPAGKEGYILAREIDQCMLTVFPHKLECSKKEGVQTRVVIALNPDMPDFDQYSLVPLAELLEQYEQFEESVIYETTGRYRRDHSRPRAYEGIFSQIPFSITADPWYISPRGDIIDSPGGSSTLKYDQILSIIDADWVVDKVCFNTYFGSYLSLQKEDSQETNISFGELYRRTQDEIQQMQKEEGNGYLLSLVNISPSMLPFSNAILQACCLNMVGKSDMKYSEDNLFWLDYRTCLYVDQFITILATADQSNIALWNKVQNSQEKLLIQRGHLHKLGHLVADLAAANETELSSGLAEVNSTILSFNTLLEQQEMIFDPLEQEIYYYLKEHMMLDRMKTTIFSSAEILLRKETQQAEEAEKRRDNQMEAVMGLFALLAIFSALVDCFDFIGKFGGTEWTAFPLSVKIAEVIFLLIIAGISIIAAVFAYRAIRTAFGHKK